MLRGLEEENQLKATWPPAELERIELICSALAEEKAEDIVAFRVGELTILVDYVLICSGRNRIQVRAITQGLLEKMDEAKIAVLNTEGYSEGVWIVVDLGHTMVHVFEQNARDFYGLERLLGDASSKRFES